jgi:hypothetical protein
MGRVPGPGYPLRIAHGFGFSGRWFQLNACGPEDGGATGRVLVR